MDKKEIIINIIKSLELEDMACELERASYNASYDEDETKNYRAFGKYVYDKVSDILNCTSILFVTLYNLIGLNEIYPYGEDDDFFDKFMDCLNYKNSVDEIYNNLLKLKEDCLNYKNPVDELYNNLLKLKEDN